MLLVPSLGYRAKAEVVRAVDMGSIANVPALFSLVWNRVAGRRHLRQGCALLQEGNSSIYWASQQSFQRGY